MADQGVGAMHLGVKHTIKGSGGFVLNQLVFNNASTMNSAVDAAVHLVKFPYEFPKRLGIPHIHLMVIDRSASPLHSCQVAPYFPILTQSGIGRLNLGWRDRLSCR